MATNTLSPHRRFLDSLIAPFLAFRITGLDISDLSMKYLSFDRVGKNKITIGAYGEIEYPAGIIVNGEVKDENKFVDILRRWSAKEKKRLPSPFVAISLPEEKSFIRTVQIPRVKREDVANAVRWEIENQIPLPLDNVVYDYEIIDALENPPDHLDVIITAFPRDILNMYVRTVKAAGFEIYAVELEVQSLVRACVPALRDNEPKIIVDIGRTRTSFVIYVGGAILYTSTIEAGGSLFEQYLSEQLRVAPEEAMKLKIDVGLDKIRHNGEVFAALVPAVTVIADELVRAISYYQNHSAHSHGAMPIIQRVLLSGGDANLRGLDTYLASVLKVPVERANPFAVIRSVFAYDIPPLTRRNALAFAIPIGLALRELRQE